MVKPEAKKAPAKKATGVKKPVKRLESPAGKKPVVTATRKSARNAKMEANLVEKTEEPVSDAGDSVTWKFFAGTTKDDAGKPGKPKGKKKAGKKTPEEDEENSDDDDKDKKEADEEAPASVPDEDDNKIVQVSTLNIRYIFLSSFIR